MKIYVVAMVLGVFGSTFIFNWLAKRWLGEHEGFSNRSNWQDKDKKSLRL